MNQTGLLHLAATVVVGAGIFVSDRTLTIGLLMLVTPLFVGGIALARDDDTGPSG